MSIKLRETIRKIIKEESEKENPPVEVVLPEVKNILRQTEAALANLEEILDWYQTFDPLSLELDETRVDLKAVVLRLTGVLSEMK